MHLKSSTLIGTFLLAIAASTQGAYAQESAEAAAPTATPALMAVQEQSAQVAVPASALPAPPEDFITPHIIDGSHLELPYWKPPFYKEVHLPTGWIVNIGGFSIDMSPTKHVVFMILAAIFAATLLIGAANSSRRMFNTIGRPRGFAAGMEAMALFLRNEVVLPNVGPRGQPFVPYLVSLFYFILCCNLFGLVPFGSTATSNISVTATLAILTFFVVEIAGVRANGLGYLSTMFYWNKDLPLLIRIPMFLLMSPIEMIGKLTKPFALAIRLFANMTAGHIGVLAIIGLIFAFGSYWVAAAPVLMATAIMMLEIFVAFLQAFIFTLLAAVFIGQMREIHH